MLSADQRLGPIWSHHVNGWDLVIAGEAQNRELAIVGNLRWLQIARSLDLVVQIARTLDHAMVEGSPDDACLQRCHALRLPCRLHTRRALGLVTRRPEANLKIGIGALAADRSSTRGKLEGVVAELTAPIGRDDEVGRPRTFAWFQEQDMASDSNFPRHRVAERHMLNRLIGTEHDLGRGAEGADNPVDLRFLILDELYARVRGAAARRILGKGRGSDQRDSACEANEPVHRTTSGSAR